jgi:hypothetical protein
MRDLDHPIVCRCRKHRQLAHQEWGFVAFFPLYVPMVPSSTLAIAIDDKCLTCSGFSLGETIRLGSFEFIANYFGDLSLSPRRSNSGVVFMGSTRSGSPSPRRAMIEYSIIEFHTTSSREGASILPSPRRHSVGALPAPVTTTPWMKNALAT